MMCPVALIGQSPFTETKAIGHIMPLYMMEISAIIESVIVGGL